MSILQRPFFARYGGRVIEPEIRGAIFALLLLMWTADLAKSHAVLPAFLLGLALSGTFKRHPEQQRRFRVVAFSFLALLILGIVNDYYSPDLEGHLHPAHITRQ